MARRSPPPMTGGEAVLIVDPINFPHREGVPVVKAIPNGDGGPALPLSNARKEQEKKLDSIVFPTRNEFDLLPRWAKVAYLVRNADRVSPIFVERLGCAKPDAAELLRRLQQDLYDSPAEVALNAYALANLISDQYLIFGDPAAIGVANAYQLAAKAIVTADAFRKVDILETAMANGKAESNAVEVARNVANNLMVAEARAAATLWTSAPSSLLQVAKDPTELSSFRQDFDLLAMIARCYYWTNETPVPQSVFGPMWPPGRTPDWAKPIS